MEFEWDPAKYQSNLAKHGIGFGDAAKLFLGSYTVTPSKHSGEARFLATGLVLGRIVTVVFTQRGGAIRIISARGARDEEKETYYALYAE